MSARLGQMRDRVVLEQNEPTQDDIGGEVADWKSITPAPIWARVRPVRGREYLAGSERKAEFSHEVTISYRASILEIPRDKLRILWNNKILNVVTVLNPDEQHYQIDMLAIEGVAT